MFSNEFVGHAFTMFEFKMQFAEKSLVL